VARSAAPMVRITTAQHLIRAVRELADRFFKGTPSSGDTLRKLPAVLSFVRSASPGQGPWGSRDVRPELRTSNIVQSVPLRNRSRSSITLLVELLNERRSPAYLAIILRRDKFLLRPIRRSSPRVRAQSPEPKRWSPSCRPPAPRGSPAQRGRWNRWRPVGKISCLRFRSRNACAPSRIPASPADHGGP
jgi:hypothetical protein